MKFIEETPVHEGKVTGSLDFPFWGWLTTHSIPELMEEFRKLDEVGKKQGHRKPDETFEIEDRWFEMQRSMFFQLDRFELEEPTDKEPWI